MNLIEKVRNQTIAQMKCKSMRDSIPEVSLGSVKERPNRGDSQNLLEVKNKSKFRIFKEKGEQGREGKEEFVRI